MNGGDGGSGGGSDGSAYRGAQGLDPEFIAELEAQFGFDRPTHERFALMLWELLPFRFRRELFFATFR